MTRKVRRSRAQTTFTCPGPGLAWIQRCQPSGWSWRCAAACCELSPRSGHLQATVAASALWCRSAFRPRACCHVHSAVLVFTRGACLLSTALACHMQGSEIHIAVQGICATRLLNIVLPCRALTWSLCRCIMVWFLPATPSCRWSASSLQDYCRSVQPSDLRLLLPQSTDFQHDPAFHVPGLSCSAASQDDVEQAISAPELATPEVNAEADDAVRVFTIGHCIPDLLKHLHALLGA
jgi:hypothetical protein